MRKKISLLLIMALLAMMLFIGCDAEGSNSSDSSDSSEPSTPPTPSIHYKIRFDANGGGSETMSDLSADGGQEITLPTCAFTAPTGKKFGNWNTAAAGSGTSYANGAKVKDLTSTDEAVVTLYAQWIEKDAHNISYLNTKNADNSSNPTSFKESDAATTLQDITAVGYTFDGWYEVINDTTSDTSTDSWAAGDKTDNVTLWAKWTVNTYTIKFDKNGGSGTDIADLSMTYDVSADLPANTFTKANNIFKGWASSADGEVIYNDGQNIKDLTSDNGAEITLYAVWSDTGILANGNLLINGTEYAYTSFVKVMNAEVTIDGTDDNWSGYVDSSASAQYKGAFKKIGMSRSLHTVCLSIS